MILFLAAVGMGFVFCSPPGPVLALAARRGAVHGFPAALRVELGSLVGDAIWAVLGLSGVGLLMRLPAIHGVVGLVGALLLGWLGLRSLREARQAHALAAAPVQPRGDFSVGALISLTNPQAVAYWMALGSSIQVLTGHEASTADYMIFFCGFMLACLAYCFVAAGVIAGARTLLTESLFRSVNLVCGLALLVFAAFLAWNTLESVLQG